MIIVQFTTKKGHFTVGPRLLLIHIKFIERPLCQAVHSLSNSSFQLKVGRLWDILLVSIFFLAYNTWSIYLQGGMGDWGDEGLEVGHVSMI